MFYRDRKKQAMKRLAIGSGIAAVAGYLAGILTAPKSGKETRGDIKHAAERGLAEAEKELKKLHTELDKLISKAKSNGTKLGGKAKQELDELVAKAKDAKEKTRVVLSAIHQGDAQDADLKKAVKEAKYAINNLKKYLKK